MSTLSKTANSHGDAGKYPVSTCAQCSSNRRCLPSGLSERNTIQIDKLIGKRRWVDRNELIFRIGDPFHSLYIVHSGHVMTFQVGALGKQHVSGFHMSGDVIGMGAIYAGTQQSNALALEDTNICEVPFSRLQELCAQVPELQQHFHKILSREICRDHGVTRFLSMGAEQRLAIFLLDLSMRYAVRGYSSFQFQLHMSREEIGSHIGITMESVSRIMSKFRQNGWITAVGKDVRICNQGAMQVLAGNEG